jgi:hypothetical protein
MPSGPIARTTSLSVVRRLTPWAVVLLIGSLLVGVLPTAQAQTGANAAEAFPIGGDGRFAGTTQLNSSVWYKFNYIGGGQTVTATVTFQPADSNRLDVFFYTGDPNNPTQVTGSPSTLTNGVRTVTFSDPGGARVVFVRVENDHVDRQVSFVGSVTPTSTIATPTPTSASSPATPQSSPTAGPIAPNANQAITLEATGSFSGTLANNQAVWYRFWYGNPGADTTVSIGVAPNADGADLNIYTGTDLANLGGSIQGGSQQRTGNTISRRVQLSSPQFVYFSLGNNTSQVIAYSGAVSPFVSPPPTITPTAGATGTSTPGPTPTITPTPVVQAAPPQARDSQYYQQTGFRVDDQALNFFTSRGGVQTFGLPVSRLFTFLGCPVQVFQRLIIQLCPGQGPALINLLDPDIFPYTRVNGSVFPSPDDALKARTPAVGSPEYANILNFIQMNTQDQFNGQPVSFWQTFQARGGLEVLGAPISQPQPDPSNNNFIYMRFQRVILHYRAGIGTEPLLLADYLKQIILGPGASADLPGDLEQQARGSRFFGQYCRGGATRWICRPNELGGTDLTFAFEATPAQP